LGKIMTSGDQAKIDRGMQPFLLMKKFDIAALMATAENREEPTS
jgi:hypothetical protein